ncbi:MAG: aminotransferase class I/II-fold pyridoxal phosphate-dependent enzyme [Dactylosporangium sp.]|nr:aminotransferase class I/II-fold pyridoxal phosphate-dependent enzyme [Dactylosporangium sp.]NNJ59651.1 aminotransferase class I/II-fold pyridoxal phosphate-dependent enzyme [Dactylosporangium sp.]
MKVSQRSLVPPFTVMEIIAAANARRAAGHRVLNLCMGEPSAGTPAAVRELAKALLDTHPLGYTEAIGTPQLRAAIAAHYHRWYGVEVDPGQVAVTTGSSGAFLLAFLAAFEPGDRVAVARPGYPAYRNILSSLGCEVVELDCGPQTRYRPTVEQLAALHAPVAGLVLAGPANPTGTLVDPATLRSLVDWCTDRGVRLISDEIYHGITYPQGTGFEASTPGTDPAGGSGPAGAPTAAGRREGAAIVVSSFSKYWAMTGWRLGWMVLPDDLVAPVDALAGNLALCPPALAQHAAVAAFGDAAYAEARANVEQYAQSRRLVLDRMPDLGWARAAPAQGAFYVYADISPTGLDSVTWCARLLDEAGVAMTPGTDFDRVAGHDWVRLSFAAGPRVVAEALERTADWQRTL